MLPPEVLNRRTKATFSHPLWDSAAVEFAQRWSGDGVDLDLVDGQELRRHWLDPERDLLSTTLLQQAWLHDYSVGRETLGVRAQPGPAHQ